MRRADRNILVIKLVFVGVFAIAAAGIWWYQLSIAKPRTDCLRTAGAEWIAKTKTCRVPPANSCERGGGWWDPQSQSCAKVVHIPDITGRK